MTRAAVLVLAILLAAGSVSSQALAQTASSRIDLPAPFALVDADGKTVSTADFAGRWLLIYFGYTHCADQCPTGLSILAEAMDEIGPAAAHVQPLFITVDPERDRGPLLREFTASFDKRLIGLGGSVDQVAAIAGALGVKFEKVLLSADDRDYAIDHSATLSLIDPTGRHGETFAMAEPYQVAAKLFDAIAHSGGTLDNVNNLRAYR
jgi:cytochrome oxidase Cu insertion factor (SCO1/SenC/PrrC family)